MLDDYSEKMSKSFDDQKKSSSNFHKLLQERIDRFNHHRELAVEKTKHPTKLEVIAEKFKCGENVQNLRMQTWLSDGKNSLN